MTLEEDLGYNLDAHLKTLKEKCRALISDKQDACIIDEAIEKFKWIDRATASGMIQEAFENSGKQDDSPLDYLRLSVYALEQDIWWLYSQLGSNMEQDLDFLKEYS